MRQRPSLFAILLALGLLAPAFAQRPADNRARPSRQQQQSPQPDEDEEVVRITTNLVQVDAVVTDKDGRHVTDLTPADFEILEDGRRQEITNFSYVSVEPETGAARPASTPAARAERGALPVPPARLRPGRARRTVELVVDDLSMSAQTTVEVRRALRKYIDEQIDTDDLSAVIRTSSGSGVLQQFTSDKRLLHAAVERLRWFPRGRGGLSAVGGVSELEVGGGEFDEHSVAGTLGALTAIVRNFQSLPGRKAVVLFTDTLPILGDVNPAYNIERYRRLVDLANRSSVTFYSVDSRGLQPLGPTAATPFGGMPHQNAAKLMGQRSTFHSQQDGMNFLARGTGGLFFRNQNNLNKGLQEVLDDQRGYYLLAYRPEDSTFDPRTGERKFRDLKVRVKRAGLSVRSRSGFFGVPEAPKKERRPDEVVRRQLFDALSSPFGAADIDLRMAALFVTDPARASAIRSIIHLGAKDLQFSEEPGGRRKAVLDVAAIVFTSDGRPAVQGRDQREVILGEEEYRHALKNGLTYRLNVPVKQPGTYNLRVAVRDAATGRTGSAREFVHVPDLARGPLALSGVALSGVEPSRAGAADAAAQLTDAAGVAAEAFDPNLSPAVRRLRHGVFLDYGYAVYNAQLDPATGQPRLTAQARLFRDGQLVFTGGVTPLDTTGQADMKRLVAGGRLQVGTELVPGDYVLQVVVTDTLVGGKGGDAKGTATQWVDFEVVK